MSTKTYPPTAEWLRLRQLASRSGRKLYWIAAQVGMAYDTFHHTFNGYPGYAGFSDAQREEIARLVDSTFSDIWPSEGAVEAEAS